MASQVRCPYCRTVFMALHGNMVHCPNRNCGAKIHVDSNGKIRRSEPGKKK